MISKYMNVRIHESNIKLTAQSENSFSSVKKEAKE